MITPRDMEHAVALEEAAWREVEQLIIIHATTLGSVEIFKAMAEHKRCTIVRMQMMSGGPR